MLRDAFAAGGPVMYAVLAAWVVVLAGVLDRLLYAAGCVRRRPGRRIAELAARGELRQAGRALRHEQARAELGLGRIDAVSRLATSIGLFGTVLGLSGVFFAPGSSFEYIASDALAAGLATALFTTVGGLVVFLVGQLFLIAYDEWRGAWERVLRARFAVHEGRVGP
jgi:hypothetical protein